MSDVQFMSRIKWLFTGLVIFALGIWMMISPEAMNGIDTSGRRGLYKQILASVWGFPAGVVLVIIGPGVVATAFLRGNETSESAQTE